MNKKLIIGAVVLIAAIYIYKNVKIKKNCTCDGDTPAQA